MIHILIGHHIIYYSFLWRFTIYRLLCTYGERDRDRRQLIHDLLLLVTIQCWFLYSYRIYLQLSKCVCASLWLCGGCVSVSMAIIKEYFVKRLSYHQPISFFSLINEAIFFAIEGWNGNTSFNECEITNRWRRKKFASQIS